MYGLLITELAILAMALGFAAITKQPFNQIFPFKKPTFRHFGGGLLIYGGAYLLVLSAGLIQMYFFPQSSEVNQFLSDFFRSETLFIALFVVAVMPGICEEFLYRGFLQSSFGGVKPWVRVLIIGVMFGIFHFDIYRFTPTMILGLAFSYIMLKTGNLWLPILFHFINNAYGILSIFLLSDIDVAADANLSFEYTIGNALLFSGIAAILIYIGWKILNNKKDKNISLSRRLLVYILSSLITLTGFVMLGLSETLSRPPIFETNMTAGIGSELTDIQSFEVERYGEYRFDFKWENAYGSAEIKDSHSNIVYESGVGENGLRVTGSLHLEKGTYTIEYIFRPVREDASFKAIIR